MVDETFERTYQSGRAELNRDLLRMVGAVRKTLGDSLTALHRIEWSAPWATAKKPARGA